MLSKISLVAGFASASYSGHGGYGEEVIPPKDDCNNFNGDMGCKDGQQTRYPDDWSKRSFQTFLKDGPDSHMYKPEYEGLGRVMCYNKVSYTADRKSATVEAKCRQHDSITKVQYNWNGSGFTDTNTF